MLSDDARFDRQRRNVMIVGSLLWALQIARIDVASLLPNHVAPGAPRNLELLWGILIVYFLWRLYQVSHDFRATRLNHLRQVLPRFLTPALLKTREVARLKNNIRRHYEPDKTISINSIFFNQNEIELREFSSGDVRYDLRPNIKWDNGSTSSSRVELVVKQYSWTWQRAALQARWSLGISTTYFTEYTLPYLIGISAAILASYRYMHAV